ncbi:hypothetical protein XOO1301 [Xanthomonas oryzae pv. oryzae KACC 10331]|uniref:Uncharacterized protein n=1 Tax=Xanthomonas oryzae pv. oryzae (strain KACC10331 / KXO85) TaxID=291331 RepID=Q5H3B6_XANOR|nr:hypothetical protein XOO1301 [Xanthomonas oryzae pv. oryzae KACC 10331]
MRSRRRHEGVDLCRRIRRAHAPADRAYAQAATVGRRHAVDRMASAQVGGAGRGRGGDQHLVAGGAISAGVGRWQRVRSSSDLFLRRCDAAGNRWRYVACAAAIGRCAIFVGQWRYLDRFRFCPSVARPRRAGTAGAGGSTQLRNARGLCAGCGWQRARRSARVADLFGYRHVSTCAAARLAIGHWPVAGAALYGTAVCVGADPARADDSTLDQWHPPLWTLDRCRHAAAAGGAGCSVAARRQLIATSHTDNLDGSLPAYRRQDLPRHGRRHGACMDVVAACPATVSGQGSCRTSAHQQRYDLRSSSTRRRKGTVMRRLAASDSRSRRSSKATSLASSRSPCVSSQSIAASSMARPRRCARSRSTAARAASSSTGKPIRMHCDSRERRSGNTKASPLGIWRAVYSRVMPAARARL